MPVGRDGGLRGRFRRPDLPLVAVSSVAAVIGGPLTILEQAVTEARGFDGANFVFLVHDEASWEAGPNVAFVGVSWARRTYLHRIVAEYALFPALSRRWAPAAWLSLLDTTPPVRARRQAVYCQNPLPYWRPTLSDLRLAPFEVVRARTYGLVYRTLAGRNDYLVGQLPWFTEFIGSRMGVPRDRWLVVTPDPVRAESPPQDEDPVLPPPPHDRLECLYVSLPRVFKNFEEAIDLCAQPGVRLTLTISGEENRYARRVRDHARGRGEVRLVGALPHAQCLATTARADVVLFPSRLETFGLPIREAIDLGRTVVLPVRPWTAAIASTYEGAYFYRSVEEGRAILAALARGERPPAWRPPPPASNLRTLGGFAELYLVLLR